MNAIEEAWAQIPAEDERRQVSWYEWHPAAKETLIEARGRLRVLGIKQPEELKHEQCSGA